jgi:hypothetical protein
MVARSATRGHPYCAGAANAPSSLTAPLTVAGSTVISVSVGFAASDPRIASERG